MVYFHAAKRRPKASLDNKIKLGYLRLKSCSFCTYTTQWRNFQKGSGGICFSVLLTPSIPTAEVRELVGQFRFPFLGRAYLSVLLVRNAVLASQHGQGEVKCGVPWEGD